MSFLFFTQTVKSRYVFSKRGWNDFICHNRINEKNFLTGYGNVNHGWTCDCYINKKHIVRGAMIFKKGNNIVTECDRKFHLRWSYKKRGDVVLI